MRRHTLAAALAALALGAVPRPAAAQSQALVSAVGRGLVEQGVGAGLSYVGVFDAIGLGSRADRQTQAKLDAILGKLDALQASVQSLQGQVGALGGLVVSVSYAAQLQSRLQLMADTQVRIRNCLDQLKIVRAAHLGTPAGDLALQEYAAQIVGAASGPCDLKIQFGYIHAQMTPDPTLGGIGTTAYTVLARVAADQGADFEAVAGHFLNYHLQQRAIVELIRQAYVSRGEAVGLALTVDGPGGLAAQLRDEEVALLQAADTFQLAQRPANASYDVTAWLIADLLVQRLENVPEQLTTASVAWIPVTGPIQPAVVPPGGGPVALGDSIAGRDTSYYGSVPNQLTGTSLWYRTCPATGTGGYGYVAPDPSGATGYTVGDSCTVTLARHLLRSPPAAATDPASTWSGLRGGGFAGGTAVLGDPRIFNGATLANESPLDALALQASERGRASGASTFTLVPAGPDPSVVALTVDLPSSGQVGVRVRAGPPGGHPFVAGGGGAEASFQLVPAGPDRPDAFALREVASGQWLAPSAGGDAVLAAAPFTFELVRSPSGGTELSYDDPVQGRGVLYANQQTRQWLMADTWGDYYVNTALVTQDGVDEPHWDLFAQYGSLSPTSQAHPVFRWARGDIWPFGCLSGLGTTNISLTMAFDSTSTRPYSYCSENYVGGLRRPLPYYAPAMTLRNPLGTPRKIQLTMSAWAEHATGWDRPGAPPFVTGGASFHCWIGNPTIGTVNVDTPRAAEGGFARTTTPYEVTIPAHDSVQLVCIWGDGISYPSIPTLGVAVTPCQTGLATCQSY